MKKTGLNIVLTGDGKGKTTSSLGMILRALGHQKKVCLIQFLKSPDSGYGEINILNKLGVENYQIGAGCTWIADDNDTIDEAKKAWTLACEKINSNTYDLIVLDEINHVINFPNSIGRCLFTPDDLIQIMRNKPEKLTLVLTGRYASPEIIAEADTVSEIKCIKHHYQNGIKATKGIEY
ncbi:MAG: cob(I)yrinic acid a,c-diamide adenosyltransferase [Marinilabiliaceae bacterium]|nr:cob(I)yrinic acid a,c-diamide adenosyltransferase [Marinilabiliaceae bacterium]